jgi:8-amino-3,8-dideoxy-alpha-D-manno-octulosonate transaminase
MAGGVCDMESIMAVAREHGVSVLEDCAQANGGTLGGRYVGTFGTMGMFSLQINKNVTAGEGGLLVTDDDRLFTRAATVHDLGFLWAGGGPTEPESYALSWGQGRRMSELCGAVASVQIKKLPEIVSHMRASHRRIKSMLSDIPGVSFRRFHDEDGQTGSFLVMIMESEAKARQAVERMKQSGISAACRLEDYGLHIYYNIPSLVGKVPLSSAGNPWNVPENASSVNSYAKGTCPNSDALFARSVLLPIPSRLTPEQEQAGAKAVRQALGA